MKNLLVIFGGCSSEYSVSLRSSASVLRNIDKSKYNVITLGITRQGGWYLYTGDIDSIENDSWYQDDLTTPAVLSPDKNDKALIVLNDMGAYEKIKIDVIFPVLHGKNGEDGTIQGIFEMADIAYVGCTPLAGAMCMDKAITNTICDAAGIPQAKWVAFTKYELDNKEELTLLLEHINYLGLIANSIKRGNYASYNSDEKGSFDKIIEVIENEEKKYNTTMVFLMIIPAIPALALLFNGHWFLAILLYVFIVSGIAELHIF